jgi:CDP-glycerol glycerophosphotransferase (TagB/SpsB family)
MEAMPADVFLIIRNHPFVKEAIPVPDDFRDRVLDLSGEEHINDLMMISDLLITDYSSSIFEAALLDLPMVFYAYDLHDYMAERDFYLDFEAVVPGPVEKNFDDLILSAAALLPSAKNAGRKKGNVGDQEPGDSPDAQNQAYKEKAEKFREDFLGALDGRSTERICAYIRERLL